MKIRALMVLLVVFLTGCKEELYSNLSEREANKMLAVLLQAGVLAVKKAGGEGQSIWVEESQFPQAMSLLDARGLPSTEYTNLGEVFQKEGIVASPTEERARYIYALNQELSHTVAQIDGVLNARILVNLPESDMLGRAAMPSTASVAIHHRADASIEAQTPNIKMLVANSIEGLVYDNVTVVNFPVAASDPVNAPIPLQEFAGIIVHSGSVSRLQMLLGGLSVFSVLGLGFGASTYWRRNSHMRNDASEASDLL